VQTDNGPRVVLEQRRQRWLSPKYLEKVLESAKESQKEEKQKDAEGGDVLWE